MVFSLAGLDPKTRAAFRDDLLAIADTKLVLGNFYAVCIMNGRSLPDFASLTAMTGATFGHARALYQYLVSFGTDYATLERGRGADDIRSMNLFDVAPKGWEDFLVTAYLAEEAGWSMMSGFLACPDRVLGGLVEKIGQEVYFHLKYLSGWMRVVAGDAPGKAALIASFESRFPVALQWFGTDAAADALHVAGLRNVAVSTLRKRFTAEASDVATRTGLAPRLAAAPDPGDGWRAEARRIGSLPPRLYDVIRFKDQEAAH